MRKHTDIEIGHRALEEAQRLFPSVRKATIAVNCGPKTIYAWRDGVAPSAIYLARMHELGADIIYILTGKRTQPRTGEKNLIPVGDKVRLSDLEPGTLFEFDGCIALKSEYLTARGAIEAHIVGSGEQFWGGAKSVKEQWDLMVQPLELEELRCSD